MFKSIQTRTMFFMVSFAVSLIIVISYILIAGMEKVGHDMTETALSERTALLVQLIETRLKTESKVTPKQAYKDILANSNLSQEVMDATFLISSKGKTIGYPTEDEVASYKLSFQGGSTAQYVYKNGENYIVGISSLESIPGLDSWFVCSEIRFSQAFVHINNMKTIVIVLVTGLLFFLWPLSRRISTSIASPIQSLSSAAFQIAAGDISHEIATDDKNEIGDIASSFNVLLNNLKSTMGQVLSKSGEAASMKEIMEYVEKDYDNLPGGIISINNIGDITTFNEVAEELFGIKAEELLGLDIKNPIPKEIKPITDALRRCLAKGSFQLKTLADVYNIAGEKISILYSVTIQFGLKNEVLGAVCVFRKIEDIERFEESTARAKSLESLGEMAASLAHEIKNPLTSIRGYTQLINIELTEKDINLDELNIIIHETDRLTLMLDRFLNFTRPKVPELAIVDLEKLATYVVNLTKPDLPKNIELITAFKKVPPVMLDSELFEPVILNLLLNAIQALPNGGRINIRTGYNYKRKMVYLEFIDNGVGIPIEMSEKIFQPFFTTKEEGVGMGLAIASRIIEAHKGILEVESIVGKMTKFTILLQSVELDTTDDAKGMTDEAIKCIDS